MSQESIQATQTRELLAGELAPEEERILRCLRDLFAAVVEHRVPFHAVVRPVKDRLVALLRTRKKLAALEAFDVQALRDAVEAESARLGPDAGRAVTPAEEEFARDIIAVMDYTVMSGLRLASAADAIVQDLREVMDFNNLEEALRANAHLKCHGYREWVEMPAGDPEHD